MAKSSVYAEDLRTASQEAGCPVCRLVDQAVRRNLDSLFYEYVNDDHVRLGLRKSRGLCNQHAWQAVDEHIGSALGFALLYRDVVAEVVEGLPHAIEEEPEGSNLIRGKLRGRLRRIKQAVKALTPTKECPVCTQREETEVRVLESLTLELGNAEFLAALEASDGLCTPHLLRAVQRLGEGSRVEALLAMEHGKLEALHAELSEIIRKNDYRFIDEEWGLESDSWRRAIQKLNGLNRKKPAKR